MTPQLTTLVLIIAAALGGYVLGLIDSRVTSRLRKKATSPRAGTGTTSETPPLPPLPPLSETLREGEKTVLKVSMDENSRYHLELDGNRLENPEQMSPEQRQRAINVVIQMRPWLDGRQAPPPAPAAPTSPARFANQIAMPASQRVAPQQPIQSMPAAKAGARKDSLKINPLRGFSSMLTKDVRAEIDKKPASIVSMIDEVLQAKLPATPFQGQGIRLEDGPTGEVMVHVGSQVYSGIDAVPDQGIRSVIRAAITEWEKK